MIGWISGFVMGQKSAAKALSVGSASTLAGTRLERQVDDLEEQVGRLTVLTEAMWLLLSSHGHDEDALRQAVTDVQERSRRQGSTCRSCQSRLAYGETRCQICGATQTGGLPTG